MIRFNKYHGLGNDFIIIDNREDSICFTPQEVEGLCHRRFGIGADGVVLVGASQEADARMTIINSDGSRPSMCGNASRCIARYLYDKGIVRKREMSVETDAGILVIRLTEDGNGAIVNMGTPVFLPERIPCKAVGPDALNQTVAVCGVSWNLSSLNTGVPHTVIFSDNLDDDFVIEKGKQIENLEYFPEKTNVNFVKIQGNQEIILRTWERGAGYTLACGTGACAAAAAGIALGRLRSPVTVHLRGGDLVIRWDGSSDIFMEGPAEEVFEGILLKKLVFRG